METEEVDTQAPVEASKKNNPRGYISFSQLNTYNNCGKKYELSYMYQLPREASGAAMGGSAIHEAIAESEKEQWWQTENHKAMEQHFQKVFLAEIEEKGGEDVVKWGKRKSRDFPEGEALRWWMFNAPLMLRRYVQIRQDDTDRGMDIISTDVERKVSAFLEREDADPILLMGYIDAMVMVSGDGEPIIRDWKTGAWPGDPAQLAMYSWILAHMEEPLFVTRGQMVKLRGTKREYQLQDYDLTKKAPVIPLMVEQSLKGIELGVFPIQPGMLCPSCSVRDACEWGQTLPKYED